MQKHNTWKSIQGDRLPGSRRWPRRLLSLLGLCFYVFGGWLSSLYPSELAGLFIHRGLDDPDKDREADFFSPQKPSSARLECPADQFPLRRIVKSVYQGQVLEKKKSLETIISV